MECATQAESQTALRFFAARRGVFLFAERSLGISSNKNIPALFAKTTCCSGTNARTLLEIIGRHKSVKNQKNPLAI